MSDQGERGVRWTDMSESEPRDESREGPGAEGAPGPQVAFPEPKVPEVFMPAPTGRTDFSDPGEGSEPPHDVWGRVEESPPPVPPPAAPRREESWRDESWRDEAQGDRTYGDEAFGGGLPPAPPSVEGPRPEKPRPEGRDAEDVKVAPVPEEDAAQWEGALFDEGAGVENYTPAVPTGSGQPARPGKPSSGNWQMPDWMADEAAADAKLGASPKAPRDVLDGGGGRSRLVLFGGVGLLVVALIAAGAVYFMKNGADEPAESGGNADQRAAAEQSEAAKVKLPPDKPLARFAGTPSKMLGRVNDAHSGLSYPRLAAPWRLPTKQNKLGTAGWSGQQILVTENHGGQLWYGQLLTGTLLPSLQSAYVGPKSVKNVAGLVSQGYEAQYYAFPHKTAPLASQALNVDGHQGWLVASYLTYKRDGVRATGEVVATGVIDTGREAPAVVFASMPNTHKKRWPDVNEFLAQLKIAP